MADTISKGAFAYTCLSCERRSMVPSGDGYKCRDCGAEDPYDAAVESAQSRVLRLHELLLTNETPATGEATVRIGDGPPLTRDQLRDVLVVGGVEWRQATFAASRLLQGTTGMPIVQRTAQDVCNEMEVKELREQRELLLNLVRQGLSPLQVQALDALIDWQIGSSLAETLDISPQHAANLTTMLHRMGLLERKHLSMPGPGRSPGMFRTVDAIHGPARHASFIEAVRTEARRLQAEAEL